MVHNINLCPTLLICCHSYFNLTLHVKHLIGDDVNIAACLQSLTSVRDCRQAAISLSLSLSLSSNSRLNVSLHVPHLNVSCLVTISLSLSW